MVHALVDILRLGLLGEMKVLTKGLFNHLAGTGNDELVRQVEELGRELCDESPYGALVILAPVGVLLLTVGKEILKGFHLELFVVKTGILPSGNEVELALHILEAGIDRRGGEHQNLDITLVILSTLLYNLVNQLLIAAGVLIAEVVALINDDEELVAALEVAQIGIVILLEAVVLEVRVEPHDIVEIIPLEL